MLDWLIIGGGVHGTYLSHYLTGRCGVSRDTLRVLDPHATPLARWEHCAHSCGMEYLRSSRRQHLGLKRAELREFALNQCPRSAASDFQGEYQRPALALFETHSHHVIARHGLTDLRTQGRALEIRRSVGGFVVETEAGEIAARRVVLALGSGEAGHWPVWADALRRRDAPIAHVFEAGFGRNRLPIGEHVAVIGGGITAAHLALSLARRGCGQVTLLPRHPLRLHAFDVSLCWFNGKCHEQLQAERDMAARRDLILRTHFPASLPPELLCRVLKAVAAGTLHKRQAEVCGARLLANGRIQLESAGDKATLIVDRVVLATGFASGDPMDGWLRASVESMDLPRAPCGFPILRPTLEWTRGLHVLGPLAELEISPAARIIAGARYGANRIAASL